MAVLGRCAVIRQADTHGRGVAGLRLVRRGALRDLLGPGDGGVEHRRAISQPWLKHAVRIEHGRRYPA